MFYTEKATICYSKPFIKILHSKRYPDFTFIEGFKGSRKVRSWQHIRGPKQTRKPFKRINENIHNSCLSMTSLRPMQGQQPSYCYCSNIHRYVFFILEAQRIRHYASPTLWTVPSMILPQPRLGRNRGKDIKHHHLPSLIPLFEIRGHIHIHSSGK